MSNVQTEQLKKFVFSSKCIVNGEPFEEKLEVIIPELLQGTYSFYTWPSAPVLAWFIWENRQEFYGKKVVELGSGTALPGIVAAKCGANVILTESASLTKSLSHTRRSCQVNNLIINKHIRVIGLTWGLFLSNLDYLGPLDYILGSDCFFEPSTFEDILVTVSYLLDINTNAKFFCTYQERSSDWSIEHLLSKWELECIVHNTNNLGNSIGLNIHDLIGDHSIHLLEIFRKA